MKHRWGMLCAVLTIGLAGCGGDGAEEPSDEESTEVESDVDAGDGAEESEETEEPETDESDSEETDPEESDTDETDGVEVEDDAGAMETADASAAPEAGVPGEGGVEEEAGAPSTGDAAATEPDAQASGDGGSGPNCEFAELSTYVAPDGDVEGFAVDGDRVVVASGGGGLALVDMSDPGEPDTLGTYDFGPGRLAFRVSLDGELAYVGLRGDGWAVVDLSDPGDMSEVSFDDAHGAEDVLIQDDVLFVADGNGVVSVDVSDPEAPVDLTTDLVLPGSSRRIVANGELLYVASEGAGLSVVDASDPSALSELLTFDLGNGSSHLALADDRLYVTSSDGVTVFDVSDAAAPAQGETLERDRTHEVLAGGGFVYIFGDDTASRDVPFISVAQPASENTLQELGVELNTFEAPVWATLAQGTIYVSVEDDGALHALSACTD